MRDCACITRVDPRQAAASAGAGPSTRERISCAVRVSTAFLPFFLLALVNLSRLTWSPVDVELGAVRASLGFGAADLGLFTGKAAVLFCAAGLAPFYRYVGNPVRQLGLPLCVLLALAAASVVWSPNKGVTLFALAQLTVCIGYPILACRLFGYAGALRVVWWFGTVVILVSIVLALLHDSHALMGGLHEGRWRGLFGHKNGFAPFVALHLLITLFGRAQLKLPLPARFAIIAVDLLAVAKAQSSTATLALAAGLLAGFVLFPIRHVVLRNIWRGLGIVGLAALAGVAFAAPNLPELLGRDATLSSRTLLWEVAAARSTEIKLGTGYGTAGGGELVSALQSRLRSKVVLGVQNAYLFLALELGWLAVAIFVGWMLSVFVAAFFHPGLHGRWTVLAAVLTEHAVGGAGESFNGIFPGWSFMVVVLATVGARLALASPASRLRLAAPSLPSHRGYA